MGWLLGCFNCAGKLEEAKPKKHLSGVHHLVPGRSNSAAVAHATSPEDLRVVRKPSSLASREEHLERGPNKFLTSSLRDDVKPRKSAKSFSEQAEERVQMHNDDMDEGFENFRERLLQDVNSAKQLSDEVKYLSGCLRPLDSPSDACKVTFDSSAQDASKQMDPAKHNLEVSSHVVRTQPGGLGIDARSKCNTPLLNVNEGNPSKNRGVNASQNNAVDSSLETNSLKRATVDGIFENLLVTQNGLHQGKNSYHYVPSPPWLFSTVKGHGQSFCNDELSEDLLMEHLDVASFIQDSALITDWELSSSSSFPDTFSSNDQFLSEVPSWEKLAIPIKSFSEQGSKRHLESRIDGNISDLNLNYSTSVLEYCTKDGLCYGVNPFLNETCWDSHGGLSETIASYSVNEAIEAKDMTSDKDSDYLFHPEICAAAGSDSISSSQSCLSSRFRLLENALSNAADKFSPQESNMRDYMLCSFSGDTNELLLPTMHPEVEPLQEPKDSEDEHLPLLSALMKGSLSNDEGVGYLNGSDVHVNGDASYLNISSLEAMVPQDTRKDLPLKELLDVTMSGKLCLLSFPIEKEDGKQRKKANFRDDGSPGGVFKVMVEEDDKKVLLFDATATDDGVQSSLNFREDILSKQERTVSKHEMHESPLKPSLAGLPSPPHVGTPLSATVSHSPARLADERPIIGTVATHWSPITTRKWWDGKGIPNSTYKYQEDQKVNWHAIPFEVRLDQALAKQNTVL